MEVLITPCSPKARFLHPEVLCCNTGTRTLAFSTLEIYHITMHAILVLVLCTIDHSQVMIWNIATKIPTTPGLIIAVALLPHFPCPRQRACIFVCPTADPWENHTCEPGDWLPSITEGVQCPILARAVIALPEPCHCSVLYRGGPLSIHTNVVPSHP